MLRYKIIETSEVTDAELERIVNEWVSQGWELEGFQFITHDTSRRPAMAFVIFTASDDDEEEEEDEDDFLEEEDPAEGAAN